jgi:hypothetical protein
MPIDTSPDRRSMHKYNICFFKYLFQRLYWRYLQYTKNNHEVVPVTNLASGEAKVKGREIQIRILKKDKKHCARW